MTSHLSQPLRLAVSGLCVCIALSSVTLAQQRRYQPSTPTVSPYLNLTRRDVGGLPNYYAFVRPMQQQQAAIAQEQSLRVQQARELEELQAEVRLGQTETATATGTGSWYMNSGTRSRFLDTTRYYPQSTLPAGPGLGGAAPLSR